MIAVRNPVSESGIEPNSKHRIKLNLKNMYLPSKSLKKQVSFFKQLINSFFNVASPFFINSSGTLIFSRLFKTGSSLSLRK
jgi:hypothetical protein